MFSSVIDRMFVSIFLLSTAWEADDWDEDDEKVFHLSWVILVLEWGDRQLQWCRQLLVIVVQGWLDESLLEDQWILVLRLIQLVNMLWIACIWRWMIVLVSWWLCYSIECWGFVVVVKMGKKNGWLCITHSFNKLRCLVNALVEVNYEICCLA